MYACPRWGGSNYSVGWPLKITEFRSFSSQHMIVTLCLSNRFKLERWDFCANRSARNLYSKLCVPPWRINAKVNDLNKLTLIYYAKPLFIIDGRETFRCN